jgi:hypothetical protein
MIDGVRYQAHRLAWFYVNRCWPRGVIDHEHGHTENNRIANLRDVTRRINQQNQRRPHKDSRTGFLGVTKLKDTGRYQANIASVDGIKHSLGCFDTPEEAHKVYVEEKRRIHEGCTL